MAPDLYDLTRITATAGDDPAPTPGLPAVRLQELNALADEVAVAGSLSTVIVRIVDERPGGPSR